MKAGQHPMAPEIGYKPMAALLEKTRDFTAVFCFNDIAAIGAIRALKDAGLSVPGDVSVVGFRRHSFGGLRHAVAHHRAPAARRRWAGAERRCCWSGLPTARRSFPAEIVMRPELVVRESTGPAKSGT